MLAIGAYVLAEDPIVLAALNQANTEIISRHAPRGSEIHLLRGFDWTHERWLSALRCAVYRRRNRHFRIHWMCNTEREVARLRRLGESAEFCHHNLYCLDTVFQVIEGTPKKMDAVYVAAFSSFKRPWLAAGVPRLRIVSYVKPTPETVRKYHCEHADINQEWVSRAVLPTIMNEAYCGLALSREEGGMIAATEYLLSGLPIVSTASTGGRDVWFTPYNHLHVPANPQAVAEAVRELCQSPRDPRRIRSEALTLMRSFRERYVEFVNRLAGREAITVPSLFGDHRALLGRFVLSRHLPELLGSYNGKQFEARHLIGANTLDPS